MRVRVTLQDGHAKIVEAGKVAAIMIAPLLGVLKARMGEDVEAEFEATVEHGSLEIGERVR